MDPIVLEDASTGSRALIAAEWGFNCFELKLVTEGQTIDVIDAAEDFAAGTGRPSGSGIPLLFPFPNRIRGGRFRWGGRNYELLPAGVADDGNGNAIHGFCLDRPWRVAERGARHVVGEFQLSVDAPDRRACWPADFLIQVRYELAAATLAADIRIVNPDQTPLPWGFGTHPYFRLPLSTGSEPADCLIQAAAHEKWDLIDCLPTGDRRPVAENTDLRDGAAFGQLRLDDMLTGLVPTDDVVEHLIIDAKAGLQITQRCDPCFRELVVYTPPGRPAICLEPYTCPTDAVNLAARDMETGWRVLDPGRDFLMRIEIEAGPVLV